MIRVNFSCLNSFQYGSCKQQWHNFEGSHSFGKLSRDDDPKLKSFHFLFFQFWAALHQKCLVYGKSRNDGFASRVGALKPHLKCFGSFFSDFTPPVGAQNPAIFAHNHKTGNASDFVLLHKFSEKSISNFLLRLVKLIDSLSQNCSVLNRQPVSMQIVHVCH